MWALYSSKVDRMGKTKASKQAKENGVKLYVHSRGGVFGLVVCRCLQCGCCPPPLVLHGTADWQRKGRSWVLAVCTMSYVLSTSVVAGSTTRFSPSTVVDVCGGGGVAIANNSGNRSSTKNNNWMLKKSPIFFLPHTKIPERNWSVSNKQNMGIL
jgi:hypothetical protein